MTSAVSVPCGRSRKRRNLQQRPGHSESPCAASPDRSRPEVVQVNGVNGVNVVNGVNGKGKGQGYPHLEGWASERHERHARL